MRCGKNCNNNYHVFFSVCALVSSLKKTPLVNSIRWSPIYVTESMIAPFRSQCDVPNANIVYKPCEASFRTNPSNPRVMFFSILDLAPLFKPFFSPQVKRFPSKSGLKVHEATIEIIIRLQSLQIWMEKHCNNACL